MSEKEEYIGDGCYASYDGWQVRLRAPRDEGNHVVYLDPQLMRHLIEFAQRVGMVEKASNRESGRQ